MKKFAVTVPKVLASRKFFWFIVGLLIFQAVWLALSFKFAMLWDEEYHFGVIQFYAHHLNPFVSSQPHNLDMFGNVIRSPKYLYHYLMSFPYRLIADIWHTQTSQVLVLRFINIALFAGGLVAFRAALLRLTKSRATVHLALLVLVLLPISSLLAAQINYDNMLFLLAGLIFYWTFRLIQSKPLDAKWLFLVVGIGLLTTLVEYNFLPIMLAIFVCLLVWLGWFQRRNLPQLKKTFIALNKWAAVGLVALVVVSGGLFAERFGGNLIEYHKLNPGCQQVLSVARCRKGSAYEQGYQLSHQVKQSNAAPQNPVEYFFANWFGQIYTQYFNTGQRIVYGVYVIRQPLPLPIITVSAALLLAVVCVVILLAKRQLRLGPEAKLVIIGGLALALVLFVFDYKIYRQTHAPLAIQGRYLMPVALFVLLFGIVAVKKVIKNKIAQSWLAIVLIVGLLAGGGLMTDLVRSDPNWYWPNQTVVNVNQDVKNSLRFLTLGLD